MIVRFVAIAATALLGLAPALAAEQSQAPAGYVRTGESTDCLRTSRIDTMKILNTEQILVRMKNGDSYLQQPSACSPLRESYAFQYETISGDLCTTTQITLVDTGFDLNFAGVCMFDKFEKLEKQSAAAN